MAGRPEKRLEPDDGPVQRLAYELRLLRDQAGSPTYRTMAQRVRFSVTTLAQAASGERMPSLQVLRAYAQACGADPDEWQVRWNQAVEESAATLDAGGMPPPYRGPAPYEPEDRAFFFGRDRLVAELVALVTERRFAILSGASGSGKSSLLRAGLVPALQETAGRLRPSALVRLLTPGEGPAAAYDRLLNPCPDEPEMWVVVDQFEDVFALCRNRAERNRFIDLLLAAREPDSRVRVVLAVRADYRGRCAEHAGLAQVLRDSSLRIGPMSPAELREAVTGPAAAEGLLVERELTNRLVQDVANQPGGLPILSRALLETWRKRRGRMLTLAAYEAVGGVLGPIVATGEEVYGRLSPAQARTVRQLLLRMVVPGDCSPDTPRPIPMAELRSLPEPEEAVRVVERLAHARLLTVGEDTVELAHEALLTRWPRLRGWIEEDRERLREQCRLTEAARIWQEFGRDPGALYRGIRLARAEEFFTAPTMRGALTAQERAFLSASRQACETERWEAARTTRRARCLWASLSAVLAVVLTAALASLRRTRTGERLPIGTAGPPLWPTRPHRGRIGPERG
ncbi:helix-turn-helix domain-containing protein [Streptomyces scabiei]|uniref:helix-turn-helix domain-containing protein n=1 Tax=Streptomyces scabiei TaxID=1930 RepID=UPI00068F0361|nr:helix-turn-helix transcriptional regulator [Streptomyces scabiei]